MWDGVNPNFWPELVSLRAKLALRSQTPTREWPLFWAEAHDALLVVREWPDGSVTAYTRPTSEPQGRMRDASDE